MALPNINSQINTVAAAAKRVRIWYAMLIIVMAIFGLRLFYVQVIRYQHYKTAALSDQLKQYQIPATRGLIEAQDGSSVVPIVLNQQLYTLYADPTYVQNADQDGAKVAAIIGGQASNYAQQMRTKNTRYVVLVNRLTSQQSTALLNLKLPGLGTQAQDYRTYPQGSLASQVLGFVNNDGTGEYGLEQDLNKQLSGTPGQVKAVTDVNGIPLAANKGNIETSPVNGTDVVTTLDLSMQTQMEQILAQEYQKTKSQGISAIILDPNTGQIKAMANYPTYNPADYQDVSDPSLFENAAVTNAIEPGSSMKTLTTAAALNLGAIEPNETFYDPAHWVVDGFNITDIEQDGAGQQDIASILALSLNTGATWMLMQMSNPGGTQITQKGIDDWHNYMVSHYRLGQATNVEQGYESPGLVPADDPNTPALALTYANTAFGQGVQLTALQLGAAFSSVVNGGTYYQPTLVNQLVAADGRATANPPKILEKNVISAKTSGEMLPLLENVVTHYFQTGFSYMSYPNQYIVGGKTGTAQVAQPGGGYYADKFNGTYVGFVGGDKPQYVIVVFNVLPNVAGYAGSAAGQPVFADLAHMLINNNFVTPKSQ